jgi:hypothetical protein
MRRWILVCLLLLGWAAARAPGFDPVSKVNSLRVLAVTIDRPYAQPGDAITFSMTVHDGFGEDGEGSRPRDLEVLWLGGCFNPIGDQYFLCLQQIADLVAPLGGGSSPGGFPAHLIKQEVVPGTRSGDIGTSEFTLTLPDDIISSRPAPQAGPHYGIAYVFFAACAGNLIAVPLEDPGAGQVPEFPLRCVDPEGNVLGSESFMIGYTQVYAFADQRENDNPPIDGLSLDGVPIDAAGELPVVPACPVSAEDRRGASCGTGEPTEDCRKIRVGAMIRDVAELDPGATDIDGNPAREIIWVTYLGDGGDLSPSLSLVSDATKGYQPDFSAEWIPPADPGIYSLWAVARDQRGGSAIIRRYVRVQ